MQKMSRFAALRGIYSQNVCKMCAIVTKFVQSASHDTLRDGFMIHGGKFVTFWDDFEKTFWDF